MFRSLLTPIAMTTRNKNQGCRRRRYPLRGELLETRNLLAFTVTNLGLDATGGQYLDGNLLAIGVREASQGNADLNGDLDTSDSVAHLFDASTSSITNLEVDGFTGLALDGDLLAFVVLETLKGDLNGDGDTSDLVAQLFDTSTSMLTNVGLDTTDFQLDGDLLALNVSELDQGNSDLNGDGDAFDFVPHLFDASTNTVTNVAFAHGGGSRVLDGNLLAFTVSEFAHGNTDLNGDGDTADWVMHVFDVTTNTTTNLGVAAGFGSQLEGNLLAFPISESAQGATDLNGDGDTSDFVMHVFDASSSTLTNLELAGSQPTSDLQLVGNQLAFVVSESAQDDTDLNGDGDASDSVAHLFDASTNMTTNLELDVDPFMRFFDGSSMASSVFDGNLLAVRVREANQGNTDLNGDGDTSDRVAHVFNVASNTITNLELESSAGYSVSGNFFAFEVREANQGNTDLNGDGDASDFVVHVFDATSNTTTNLELANGFRFLQLEGNLLAFRVPESSQGNIDLNGDGDASVSDAVVHIVELSTPNTAPTANAGGPYVVDEGGLLTLDATASSDAHDALEDLTFEWDFDYDGLAFDVDAAEASPVFDATDLDGPSVRTVALQVTDSEGLLDMATTTVTINNVAPMFEAGADDVLFSAGTAEFHRSGITFTDPGADVWTGTVNFGDGTGDLPLAIDQPTKTFELAHTYTSEGTFPVTISLDDGDGGTHSDTFSVTVHLLSVRIGGSAWDDQFLATVDPEMALGYPLPSDAPFGPLSWGNADRVAITFGSDVPVQQSSLSIAGVNTLDYSGHIAAGTFEYNADNHTAIWTLDQPFQADRLILSLSLPNSVAEVGTNLEDLEVVFSVPFDILPGDADRNGINSLNDLQLLAINWQQTTTSDTVFVDYDGSNHLSLNDLQILALNWQTALPEAEPSRLARAAARAQTD